MSNHGGPANLVLIAPEAEAGSEEVKQDNLFNEAPSDTEYAVRQGIVFHTLAEKLESVQKGAKFGFGFSIVGLICWLGALWGEYNLYYVNLLSVDAAPDLPVFSLEPLFPFIILIPSILGLSASILGFLPNTGCCSENKSPRALAQQIFNLSIATVVFAGVGLVLSVAGAVFYGDYFDFEFDSRFFSKERRWGESDHDGLVRYAGNVTMFLLMTTYFVAAAVNICLVTIYTVIVIRLREFKLWGCREACECCIPCRASDRESFQGDFGQGKRHY